MDKRQLAAQLFLDAINGDNITAEQAKQIAIGAWEMAAIFDSCEPKPRYETISETIAAKQSRMIGCRACHGSGGKRNDPCPICHGTGKVEA